VKEMKCFSPNFTQYNNIQLLRSLLTYWWSKHHCNFHSDYRKATSAQ